MIDLPASTKVNRFLAKEKFYSKTRMNSKLRKQFTDEIEKIIWTNKISPETLNIAASEYQELQVFDIYLKGADISLSVLKHIDSCIPYPILFIAYKSDEQKAVIVLLALLSLGVKNIHLGTTLPAFLSPNVAKVLVENFNIGGITSVDEDMKMFLQ